MRVGVQPGASACAFIQLLTGPSLNTYPRCPATRAQSAKLRQMPPPPPPEAPISLLSLKLRLSKRDGAADSAGPNAGPGALETATGGAAATTGSSPGEVEDGAPEGGAGAGGGSGAAGDGANGEGMEVDVDVDVDEADDLMVVSQPEVRRMARAPMRARMGARRPLPAAGRRRRRRQTLAQARGGAVATRHRCR